MVDHDGTLRNEYDDISMKTKLVSNCFGGTFGSLRTDQKSFFSTLLSFQPYRDYKPTNAIHADRPGVFTYEKKIYLNTKNKIHLNVMLLMVVSKKEYENLYFLVLF